jgi:phosphate uptake regulator
VETRKLQKIKGGSYIVSLPKPWIEKRKLQSGEQIVMSEEEDGSMRIFPVFEVFEKPLEVTLSFEAFPSLRALEYCVDTYYIQGSSRINIISKKIIPAEQKRRLKQFRTELPGVEVAEEEANRLSFQVLLDPATFSLESLIEKTSAFSLKLQEDAVRSVVDLNIPLAKEVSERGQEAQRHYRVTIRQVVLATLSRTIAQKVGVRNHQECTTFTLIARDLSRLVYHSSSIAGHVISLEGVKVVDRGILDFIGKMSGIAYEMQKNAVDAFLKKDIKLAINVMAKMDEVRENEKSLLKRIMEKTTDMDTAIILSMIGRDLRRIAGYGIAISDDAMNRILTPAG